MKVIRFKDWDCILRYGQYGNKRTAIELIDTHDGESVAVATVNIVNADINDDEIIIKDYSENEGMQKILMDAGIISTPVRIIPTGYVVVPVCKLLVDAETYNRMDDGKDERTIHGTNNKKHE